MAGLIGGTVFLVFGGSEVLDDIVPDWIWWGAFALIAIYLTGTLIEWGVGLAQRQERIEQLLEIILEELHRHRIE